MDRISSSIAAMASQEWRAEMDISTPGVPSREINVAQQTRIRSFRVGAEPYEHRSRCAVAESDGCIEMQVPMRYLEGLAGAPI
jgi:hypothetical protein